MHKNIVMEVKFIWLHSLCIQHIDFTCLGLDALELGHTLHEKMCVIYETDVQQAQACSVFAVQASTHKVQSFTVRLYKRWLIEGKIGCVDD